MKKLLITATALVLALVLTGCMSCVNWLLEEEEAPASRDNAAPIPQARTDQAAYTIMVYLNGSDLETDWNSASEDIDEMLYADFDRRDINVVVQTGGTLEWGNPDVPDRGLARFLVGENGLEKLEDLPSASIADPATLSSFIDFGYLNYPAQRYGLVLWNHGGGSVFGFGKDELYDGEGMGLVDIRQALDNSAARETPLEFLGFDACLMATLETAGMAAPYARYLIASQETEPGYGWDYDNWLSILGDEPDMPGDEVGQVIVDSFIAFYDVNHMEDEATTLSVTDLSQVAPLTKALETMVQSATLENFSFQQIARQRSQTREFGVSSTAEYVGYDLVDMGNLAIQYAETSPAESDALLAALSNAVLYSAQGRYVDNASGLSLYYPYYDRDYIDYSMAVYRELGFSPIYYNYLADFVSALTGESIAPVEVPAVNEGDEEGSFEIYLTPEQIDNIDTIFFTAWQQVEGDVYRQVYQDSYVEIDDDGRVITEFDGYVTTIGGQIACTYEMDYGEDYIRYSVPALLNGSDVNLIMIFDAETPWGRILGAQPLFDVAGVAARQLVPILPGDTLALSYYTEEFTSTGEEYAEGAGPYWYQGESFTVGEELEVDLIDVPAGEYLYGFVITDLQGNRYETDYIVVEFWYE